MRPSSSLPIRSYPKYGNERERKQCDRLVSRDRLYCEMPKKRKVKKFRKVEAVKEIARERIGAPPASQIIVERKAKGEKHKPTLQKLLDEE